jgi:hypothetical protein
MANDFDIDALLDQALGNIHATSGDDSESVNAQNLKANDPLINNEGANIGSFEVEPGLSGAPGISDTNNKILKSEGIYVSTKKDENPNPSQNVSQPNSSNSGFGSGVVNPNGSAKLDRTSAKDRIQQLRSEIATASKSFNLDDLSNTTLGGDKNPGADKNNVFTSPNAQQSGTQQLGTQQLGTQQLGTQQLGTQQLGTQQLGTPVVQPAPQPVANTYEIGFNETRSFEGPNLLDVSQEQGITDHAIEDIINNFNQSKTPVNNTVSGDEPVIETPSVNGSDHDYLNDNYHVPEKSFSKQNIEVSTGDELILGDRLNLTDDESDKSKDSVDDFMDLHNLVVDNIHKKNVVMPDGLVNSGDTTVAHEGSLAQSDMAPKALLDSEILNKETLADTVENISVVEAEPIAVAKDSDIDMLLAAEFGDEFADTPKKVETTSISQEVSAPIGVAQQPAGEAKSDIPVVPSQSEQDFVPNKVETAPQTGNRRTDRVKTRQTDGRPAIPKYVADENVLVTPPPLVGANSVTNTQAGNELESLLNDVLDAASDTKNKAIQSSVMNEFNVMANVKKSSESEINVSSVQQNSNLRSTKKTYAFPNRSQISIEDSSTEIADSNVPVDEVLPSIGMQPIIIKKGTVKKLKKK